MIVVFEKGMTLRHIGHLDLMRCMQRALRRSDLPIRYSNGFNPHIQLSFAAPLSVGVVGVNELMDVPLAAEIEGETFTRRLNEVLPPLLRVKACRTVADDFPTLMSLVAGSKVVIRMDEGEAADKIAGALERFMASDEYVTLRKTKSGENMCNIRPFVLEASMAQTPAGRELHCVLDCNASGALKPSLLFKSLAAIAEIDVPPYIAYRERILTRDKKGALIPLEEYEHA